MNVAIPSAAGAATMDLNPIGPRAGADQGNPQVSVREIFKDDSIQVGVWECTSGGWPIVDRSDTEVASIVSGRATVTDIDGSEHVLVPGSVITLPKGWSGRWDLSETLRKVYVLIG